MFVMVAGRAQGKSVTALRWLLEQPGHRMLIVANVDRKHHLSHQALRMVLDTIPAKEFVDRYIRPNIVIAERLERIQLIGRGREIGIDDAEEVLRIMFGGRVEFATFNATLVPAFHDATQYMRANEPYPPTLRIVDEREHMRKSDAAIKAITQLETVEGIELPTISEGGGPVDYDG